jgi:hypothetical protein
MLSEEVVWHEPDAGSEYTGDLRGPDAVIRMIREAGEFSGGSFGLVPRAVVVNGERLEGREVAVCRIRAGRVVEASFHQDDADLDTQFWR